MRRCAFESACACACEWKCACVTFSDSNVSSLCFKWKGNVKTSWTRRALLQKASSTPSVFCHHMLLMPLAHPLRRPNSHLCLSFPFIGQTDKIPESLFKRGGGGESLKYELLKSSLTHSSLSLTLASLSLSFSSLTFEAYFLLSFLSNAYTHFLGRWNKKRDEIGGCFAAAEQRAFTKVWIWK